MPSGGGPSEAGSTPPIVSPIERIREWTCDLSGWRRQGAAAVLGVAAAGGLPPLHMVFMLVPAFVGLFWLSESAARTRAAFAVGWWFGVGYFAAGLYWIAYAFLVDAGRYGWMAPFAVAGLAAGLAIFVGLATALSNMAFRLGGGSGSGRLFLFAAIWTAVEWARGRVFTGLPWNLIGTTWTFADGMIQLAAVGGVYGLSLATVLIAASPALLGAAPGRPRNMAAVAAVFAALGLIWLGGIYRLSATDNGTVAGVRLRLVQPNTPQHLKWKPDLRAGHVRRLLELSRRPADTGPPPTHIIWPETAVPYNLAGSPGLLSALANVAPAGGLVIAGAPRASTGGQQRQIWNSLHAVDSAANLVATYDKVHLVPFGEYVPFRDLLNIGKLTEGRIDFSAGPPRRPLRLAGLPPVTPLICYEAIFPDEVVDPADRPGWMLNVTNDAWFGRSSGPYQHLEAARLRAVEQGIPLIRVANTGISAVVDPYGRVKKSLALGIQGILDSELPASLTVVPPFGRYGNAIPFGLIALFGGLGFLLILRERPENFRKAA